LFKSLTGKWLVLPANLRGIIWLSVGTLMLAFTDAVLKSLGRTIHPFELAFSAMSSAF